MLYMDVYICVYLCIYSYIIYYICILLLPFITLLLDNIIGRE